MFVEPFGVARVVTKAYEGIRGHFPNSGRGLIWGDTPRGPRSLFGRDVRMVWFPQVLNRARG
jgi:hypothetical protein